MYILFTLLVFYIPPIYLGWRFFYKRGIRKWAWWTWAASLFGPVGYIVFGIGYWMTYRTQENCPSCGMDTPAAKKQVTNKQGEILQEPILAWLALAAGGILTIFGLIMVLILIFGDMSGFGSSIAAALVLGTSALSWGFTELQKYNTDKDNHITTRFFKCSSCEHAWEHKTSPAAPKMAA